MVEIIGCVALVCIGIVLSMLGGSGSLLSVPILVYMFSLDVVTASSYSLFIVGTTSLFGALLKQKEQRVDIRVGLAFCVTSVIATFSTRKWLLPWVPEEIILDENLVLTKRALILGMFALLSTIASVIILTKHTWPTNDKVKPHLQYLLLIGFVIGVLAGFVGIGGGFLILPSLILLARLPFKIAMGTTLLVIGFNSLLGFLGDFMNITINWSFLLMITALAISGMLLGDWLSGKVPIRYLRLMLGWLMLICAITIFSREFIL